MPRRLAVLRRSPRGSRGAQLRLLLGVIRRLTTEYWSVSELAEDLRITRRTVWRILRALRAQCPLERQRETGRVGYYRLPRRWWEASQVAAPAVRRRGAA